MQKWEYLESTIALQEANKALLEWNDLISTHSQVTFLPDTIETYLKQS